MEWHLLFELGAREVFDDMDLVMSYLDGATSSNDTGKIVKNHLQELKITRDIDTKYFKVSVFKKGTMHIVFKDEDLLRRFNIHVGKKRNFLPMDYSNKDYKDLTQKEKEIVKDFDGGEKAYKTIERHLVLNHFSEQLLLGA